MSRLVFVLLLVLAATLLLGCAGQKPAEKPPAGGGTPVDVSSIEKMGDVSFDDNPQYVDDTELADPSDAGVEN